MESFKDEDGYLKISLISILSQNSSHFLAQLTIIILFIFFLFLHLFLLVGGYLLYNIVVVFAIH